MGESVYYKLISVYYKLIKDGMLLKDIPEKFVTKELCMYAALTNPQNLECAKNKYSLNIMLYQSLKKELANLSKFEEYDEIRQLLEKHYTLYEDWKQVQAEMRQELMVASSEEKEKLIARMLFKLVLRWMVLSWKKERMRERIEEYLKELKKQEKETRRAEEERKKAEEKIDEELKKIRKRIEEYLKELEEKKKNKEQNEPNEPEAF